jgi:hypothetical protein
VPRADGTVARPSENQTAAFEEDTTDEFTSLDETEEFVKALFFGIESTGKTTSAAFMANLPGDGDVIVINAEAGFKKSALKALGVRTDCLKIWNPPGDGVMTYEKLERLYFRSSARLRENPSSIKGIIMDSGTEISNKFLEQAAMYWYLRDQKSLKKADDDKRDSPELNEIQDYGLQTNQFRKIMRKFRDLPCHFVVTALETEGKQEGEFASKHAAPEFSPKLRTSVLGYVDVALRFTAESVATGERESETLITARTKPTRLVRAKDRLGVLPRDFPEPRFDRIADYVNGRLSAEDDPAFGAYTEVRDRAEAHKTAQAEARKARTAS